ncbi:MAG: guanine deaminase [Epulopiscium sp. Nele67-Bin004]|nr:MAG: guanine deaminase [Epulopiscium sp. Nele67-Bin004]
MDFILKGNYVYSDKWRNLVVKNNSYGVCVNGICKGVFEEIPNEYKDLSIINHSDKIIIPGLCDIHLHAPQYEFRATGMDCELLEWLDKYTFPAESKYEDVEYAKLSYEIFATELKQSTTTRAVIFATIHNDATIELMKLLEQTGLHTYVGKVNMDRNSPDYYKEESATKSAKDTVEWLEKCNFERTKPIVTPRFTPSCTDELMAELEKLVCKFNLPVQSHLCENESEINWVKELCPDVDNYAESYNKYSLFGTQNNCIMAHCIYCNEDELQLIKENNVFVAHCPDSNLNLSSGIAPIRKYLDSELHVGLGSDIGAGQTIDLFRQIVSTVQVSKMYEHYVDSDDKPLTFADSFYMATRGGGAFFGNVGAFEKGFEFDAVVIDDSGSNFDTIQRLERIIYAADDYEMACKIVNGNII